MNVLLIFIIIRIAFLFVTDLTLTEIILYQFFYLAYLVPVGFLVYSFFSSKRDAVFLMNTITFGFISIGYIYWVLCYLNLHDYFLYMPVLTFPMIFYFWFKDRKHGIVVEREKNVSRFIWPVFILGLVIFSLQSDKLFFPANTADKVAAITGIDIHVMTSVAYIVEIINHEAPFSIPFAADVSLNYTLLYHLVGASIHSVTGIEAMIIVFRILTAELLCTIVFFLCLLFGDYNKSKALPNLIFGLTATLCYSSLFFEETSFFNEMMHYETQSLSIIIFVSGMAFYINWLRERSPPLKLKKTFLYFFVLGLSLSFSRLVSPGAFLAGGGFLFLVRSYFDRRLQWRLLVPFLGLLLGTMTMMSFVMANPVGNLTYGGHWNSLANFFRPTSWSAINAHLKDFLSQYITLTDLTTDYGVPILPFVTAALTAPLVIFSWLSFRIVAFSSLAKNYFKDQVFLFVAGMFVFAILFAILIPYPSMDLLYLLWYCFIPANYLGVMFFNHLNVHNLFRPFPIIFILLFAVVIVKSSFSFKPNFPNTWRKAQYPSLDQLPDKSTGYIVYKEQVEGLEFLRRNTDVDASVLSFPKFRSRNYSSYSQRRFIMEDPLTYALHVSDNEYRNKLETINKILTTSDKKLFVKLINDVQADYIFLEHRDKHGDFNQFRFGVSSIALNSSPTNFHYNKFGCLKVFSNSENDVWDCRSVRTTD